MESKEEEDEERQKVERLVEKLKNHNNRNNQPLTPVHVSFVPNNLSSSSRKLAAAFWEFHHYYEDRSFSSYASKMHRGANSFAGSSNRRQRHGKATVKENGLDLSQFLRDPSPDHHHQVSVLLSTLFWNFVTVDRFFLDSLAMNLESLSVYDYGYC